MRRVSCANEPVAMYCVLPKLFRDGARGVPKKGLPAIAAIDEQSDNCDGYCNPAFVENEAR